NAQVTAVREARPPQPPAGPAPPPAGQRHRQRAQRHRHRQRASASGPSAPDGPLWMVLRGLDRNRGVDQVWGKPAAPAAPRYPHVSVNFAVWVLSSVPEPVTVMVYVPFAAVGRAETIILAGRPNVTAAGVSATNTSDGMPATASATTGPVRVPLAM